MTNTTLISNLTSRTKTKNWLESYNNCGVSGYVSDILYRYIIFECSAFTFEGIKRELGDHADQLIVSVSVSRPSESGEPCYLFNYTALTAIRKRADLNRAVNAFKKF